MPAMPRLKGKSTKIAFAILGIPSNMIKDKKNRYIEQRLVFDEISRVK